MKKIILSAALAVTGCVHTQEKEESTDQTPKQEEQQEKQAKKEGRPPAAQTPKSPEEQKAQKDKADTRPPAEEGRPELSTSADALYRLFAAYPTVGVSVVAVAWVLFVPLSAASRWTVSAFVSVTGS